MLELIQMTATYSNAVLVAVLPHVSDFSAKLELPIPQPITIQQVLRSSPSPYKGRIEASMVLTNHYWFAFDHRGYVASFTSPTNWFSAGDEVATNPRAYAGHTRMTTNEMVTFARDRIAKLGYSANLTHTDTTPTIEGPFDLQAGGHIPYCRIVWEPVKDQESDGHSLCRVELNTEEKTVVGLYLEFARTNQVGTPLKLDVEPETQAEFRARTKATMFTRTNAPVRLPK